MTVDIKQILDEFFIIDGNFTINSDDSVDVDGSIRNAAFFNGELPIKFGKITGNFELKLTYLTSLLGCPRVVGGKFLCTHNNKIISYQGAPETVGQFIGTNNKMLRSLEGLPATINQNIEIDWKNNLGLLRVVDVAIHGDIKIINAPNTVVGIIKKYANQPSPGERRAATVRCAMELIRAGYRDNARL